MLPYQNLLFDPPAFFRRSLKDREILSALGASLLSTAIAAIAAWLVAAGGGIAVDVDFGLRLFGLFGVMQLAGAIVYALFGLICSSFAIAGGRASFLSFLCLGLYCVLPYLIAAVNLPSLPLSLALSFVLGLLGLKVLLKVETNRAFLMQLGLAVAMLASVCGTRYGASKLILSVPEPEPAVANQSTPARKTAPDIEMAPYKGEPVRLSSFKGKSVVVLDFWATWCPPCRKALPILSQLAEHYKSRGVQFFALATRDDQPAERYLVEHNYALTGATCDEEALRSYGVRTIPETVIVDKNGRVHEVLHGLAPDEEAHLSRAIDECLKESTN